MFPPVPLPKTKERTPAAPVNSSPASAGRSPLNASTPIVLGEAFRVERVRDVDMFVVGHDWNMKRQLGNKVARVHDSPRIDRKLVEQVHERLVAHAWRSECTHCGQVELPLVVILHYKERRQCRAQAVRCHNGWPWRPSGFWRHGKRCTALRFVALRQLLQLLGKRPGISLWRGASRRRFGVRVVNSG